MEPFVLLRVWEGHFDKDAEECVVSGRPRIHFPTWTQLGCEPLFCPLMGFPLLYWRHEPWLYPLRVIGHFNFGMINVDAPLAELWKFLSPTCTSWSRSAAGASRHMTWVPRHSGHRWGLPDVGGGVWYTEVGDSVKGSLSAVLFSTVGGSLVSWLLKSKESFVQRFVLRLRVGV